MIVKPRGIPSVGFPFFFTVEFHLINEVVLLRFFDFLSVWITRDRLAWVSKR